MLKGQETRTVQLPTVTRSASTVARISIPSGLAFVAAMFPEAVAAVTIATPAVMAFMEHSLERPSRIIEDALRQGELLDLSDEQFASFIPMAYRIFLAARQGEYGRNLRLLAAFMASELKAETCEPGSLLGMARRLEGLDVLSLRAVALIGELKAKYEAQGRDPSLRIALTASQLLEGSALRSQLTILEVQDALSDLAGRGLLSGFSGSSYGGSHEHFRTTAPIEELLVKASSLAEEAMSSPTDER